MTLTTAMSTADGTKLCDECGHLCPKAELEPVLFRYPARDEAGWMCATCAAGYKRFLTVINGGRV